MLSVRCKKHIPKLIAVVVVAGVGVGVTWMIDALIDAKPATTKKTVQKITLFKPPPPPPPPPKVERPPEPRVQDEVDMPEPELAEELPELADEMPAGNDLGLDAEGGGAGDSFGLIGRKGGRSLLNGAGDPFVMFASQLQRQIEDALLESEKTRKKAYSVIARIWVTDDGGVLKAELASSTGVHDVDQSIIDVIHAVSFSNGRPPEGMQQPIKFRITSRI
jgi:protein TonB